MIGSWWKRQGKLDIQIGDLVKTKEPKVSYSDKLLHQQKTQEEYIVW